MTRIKRYSKDRGPLSVNQTRAGCFNTHTHTQVFCFHLISFKHDDLKPSFMLQPPTAEKLSWEETVASQLWCHGLDRSVSQLVGVKEAFQLGTNACQGKQHRETPPQVFISIFFMECLQRMPLVAGNDLTGLL